MFSGVNDKNTRQIFKMRCYLENAYLSFKIEKEARIDLKETKKL